MYISRSGNRQVHFKLRRTCALRDRCQQARCWLMSLSSFPPHRPRCPFALPHPRTVWLAHQEPVHSPQALYQPTPHCWFSCQVLYRYASCRSNCKSSPSQVKCEYPLRKPFLLAVSEYLLARRFHKPSCRYLLRLQVVARLALLFKIALQHSSISPNLLIVPARLREPFKSLFNQHQD